jgi:GT2 family glycosyltransferase
MGAAADVSCSVCIPTYRRAHELRVCLDALSRQIVPPREIVVSDAGGDDETRAVLEAFSIGHPWTLRHCRTDRTGLPWQRWWAFLHSTGSLILFLDDDVRLAPDAVARLIETYRRVPDIAGAGFAIAYDDYVVDSRPSHASSPASSSPPSRPSQPSQSPSPLPSGSSSLRERWLGISGARPGSITPGGISIELPLRDCAKRGNAGRGVEGVCDDGRDGVGGGEDELEDVDWLSGGAMSYRREVLAATGPLDRLFALYDEHIGKAEDSLLSSRARRFGPLVIIPGIYARHPALAHATRTESPQDGYHKGLLETWGRAHVLRWLARDPATAFRAWTRVASLELARALRAAARHPIAAARWSRIAGGLVGIQRTVRHWRHIPPHPTLP